MIPKPNPVQPPKPRFGPVHSPASQTQQLSPLPSPSSASPVSFSPTPIRPSSSRLGPNSVSSFPKNATEPDLHRWLPPSPISNRTRDSAELNPNHSGLDRPTEWTQSGFDLNPGTRRNRASSDVSLKRPSPFYCHKTRWNPMKTKTMKRQRPPPLRQWNPATKEPDEGSTAEPFPPAASPDTALPTADALADRHLLLQSGCHLLNLRHHSDMLGRSTDPPAS